MSAAVEERIADVYRVQLEDLLALARFEDRRARAVSFYFSSPAVTDKCHAEQLTALKQLGRSILCSHGDRHSRSNGLLSDINAVLERAGKIQHGSGGLKAIFACRDERIWQEFNLPERSAFHFLQSGKRFYLVPLLRAMEFCHPYCVVLVEHGKARSFLVRGTLIQEIPGLPQRDLRLHVDDSRVGWSHHIEGDQRQHAQAYLRELAAEMERLLAAQGCNDLVIGCREDLRGEIGPCLVNHTRSSLRGQFHLPRFDAALGEILQAAQPVFDIYRQKHHAELLGMVHERSGRGAEGIPAVLGKLEEGRVHTLLLGPLSDETLLECKRCGFAFADGVHSCPSCNSTESETVNAQEILARKALLIGAEIVAIDALDASVTGHAAALLRY